MPHDASLRWWTSSTIRAPSWYCRPRHRHLRCIGADDWHATSSALPAVWSRCRARPTWHARGADKMSGVSMETPLRANRLGQRAAEIEAAVQRAAERCRSVAVTETVALRLLVLLGREISALLEQTLRPHG